MQLSSKVSGLARGKIRALQEWHPFEEARWGVSEIENSVELTDGKTRVRVKHQPIEWSNLKVGFLLWLSTPKEFRIT